MGAAIRGRSRLCTVRCVLPAKLDSHDVRVGSNADMRACVRDVRFSPSADMPPNRLDIP